ncbi:MAG: hypothetical protein ABSH51_02115 [Solirubrobacteraceae bacterium]
MPAAPVAAHDRPSPHVEAVLSLQCTAGNGAVTRLVGARRSVGDPVARLSRDTATTAFSDPAIQSAYDANKAVTSSDQLSGLELLDREHGVIAGPWAKLDWAQISGSAADRMYHPEHIQQNPLGLCGPAALLNYVATATPGTYAYDVISIFEDGAWGGKKLNSTLLGNAALGGMDPCDWMMLSAIQDLSNSVLDYNGRETKYRDGQSIGDLQSSMTSLTKIQKTTEYSCGYWGVKEQSLKVNDLLARYGNGVCVVMEVDSTTLQAETARGSNDHFIRLLKPMTYGEDSVGFTVFTWGSNRSLTFKRENFEHMVDGYVVGATRSDIQL